MKKTIALLSAMIISCLILVGCSGSFIPIEEADPGITRAIVIDPILPLDPAPAPELPLPSLTLTGEFDMLYGVWLYWSFHANSLQYYPHLAGYIVERAPYPNTTGYNWSIIQTVEVHRHWGDLYDLVSRNSSYVYSVRAYYVDAAGNMIGGPRSTYIHGDTNLPGTGVAEVLQLIGINTHHFSFK